MSKLCEIKVNDFDELICLTHYFFVCESCEDGHLLLKDGHYTCEACGAVPERRKCNSC